LFVAERRLISSRFEFAAASQSNYLENMTEAQRKILKRTIKEALRIQDRFLAEPVLARTGKGYMKSEGVTTLQRIKANLKRSGSTTLEK